MKPLDLVFHALSDETRRSMLLRLSKLPSATVSELAEPYSISLAAASKHLQVLERAGIVVKTREGRVQRCRLNLDALNEASWVLDHYREFWRKRLDSLELFLEDRPHPEKTRGSKKR